MSYDRNLEEVITESDSSSLIDNYSFRLCDKDFYLILRYRKADEEFLNDMTPEEAFMFICFVLLAENRWPFGE